MCKKAEAVAAASVAIDDAALRAVFGDVTAAMCGLFAQARTAACAADYVQALVTAPEATSDELVAALEKVGAADWIAALPEGLDTAVGGRDHALTPSQTQQVALARLLLTSPAVVILDEATSMLSPDAATGVEAALDRVLRGRTTVSVAHRLSTAHAADRVAVMEHGRITELGTHDELLDQGGTYAELWKRWHG